MEDAVKDLVNIFVTKAQKVFSSLHHQKSEESQDEEDGIVFNFWILE